MAREPLRLFVRRDCELCEALHGVLLTEPRLAGHPLEIVDIDEQPEWRMAYHFRIPVLTRGPVELWAGPIDDDSRAALLERVLAG